MFFLKSCLILFLSYFLSELAVGAVDINFDSNYVAVLTAEKSPYVIENDLIINDTYTLYIEAGVEVKFSSQKSLLVYGRLVANGTVDKKIKLNPSLIGMNWGGVYFYSSTHSYFKNIEINEVAAGVYVTGSLPFISHLSINKSSSYGLFYDNIESKVSLDTINIANCDANAIEISSLYENYALNNVVLTNNRNGFVSRLIKDVKDRPAHTNTVVTMNKINYLYGNISYTNTCNIQLPSVKTSAKYFIRNTKTSRSFYMLLMGDNGSVPLHTAFITSYYDATFILKNENFKEIVFVQNSTYPLSWDTWNIDILVLEDDLDDESQLAVIKNCKFQSSSNTAISLDGSIVDTSIENSTFRTNKLAIDVRNKNNRLKLANLSFIDNEIGIQSNSSFDIDLQNSIFEANTKGVILTHVITGRSNDLFDMSVYIANNEFIRNEDYSLQIESGQKYIDVQIIANVFRNNSKRVIGVTETSEYLQVTKSSAISIKNNELSLNRDLFSLLNLTFYRELSKLEVISNNFTFNELRYAQLNSTIQMKRLGFFMIDIVSYNAMTYKISHNRLHNNGNNCEVVLNNNPNRIGAAVDLTDNYWGPNRVDEYKIMGSIYAFHKAYVLPRVLIRPFYIDNTLTTLSNKTTNNLDFLSTANNEISGVLDYTLKLAANARYIIKQDVIIKNNGRLIVSENVTLECYPRVGILVEDGQLDLQGTVDAPITLTLVSSDIIDEATNYEKQRLRFTELSLNPLTILSKFYIIEIFDNNQQQWIPVSTSVNSAAMMASMTGHRGVISASMNMQYYYNASTNVTVTCNQDAIYFDQCSVTSAQQQKLVSVFTLHLPLSWSGIYLTQYAKASLIEHVRLFYYGWVYYHNIQSAIRIDYHQHRINNLYIDEYVSEPPIATNPPASNSRSPTSYQVNTPASTIWIFNKKNTNEVGLLSNITIPATRYFGKIDLYANGFELKNISVHHIDCATFPAAASELYELLDNRLDLQCNISDEVEVVTDQVYTVKFNWDTVSSCRHVLNVTFRDSSKRLLIKEVYRTQESGITPQRALTPLLEGKHSIQIKSNQRLVYKSPKSTTTNRVEIEFNKIKHNWYDAYSLFRIELVNNDDDDDDDDEENIIGVHISDSEANIITIAAGQASASYRLNNITGSLRLDGVNDAIFNISNSIIKSELSISASGGEVNIVDSKLLGISDWFNKKMFKLKLTNCEILNLTTIRFQSLEVGSSLDIINCIFKSSSIQIATQPPQMSVINSTFEDSSVTVWRGAAAAALRSEWRILNNQFTNLTKRASEQLLGLFGSGVFSGNKVSSNELAFIADASYALYPRGLISFTCATNDDEIIVENNQFFMNNVQRVSLLNFNCSTFIRITNNTFAANQVLDLKCVTPQTGIIKFNGINMPRIKYNRFSNERKKYYEITGLLNNKSQHVTEFLLDLSYNYWGENMSLIHDLVNIQDINMNVSIEFEYRPYYTVYPVLLNSTSIPKTARNESFILNGIINRNLILTKQFSPYLIDSSAYIRENVTVTIEPGVHVQLMLNSKLYVEGTLVANGTRDEYIRFSVKLQSEDEACGTRIEDQSHSIYLKSKTQSPLVYVNLTNFGNVDSSSKSSSWAAALVIDGYSPYLENVNIESTIGFGLLIENCYGTELVLNKVTFSGQSKDDIFIRSINSDITLSNNSLSQQFTIDSTNRSTTTSINSRVRIDNTVLSSGMSINDDGTSGDSSYSIELSNLNITNETKFNIRSTSMVRFTLRNSLISNYIASAATAYTSIFILEAKNCEILIDENVFLSNNLPRASFLELPYGRSFNVSTLVTKNIFIENIFSNIFFSLDSGSYFTFDDNLVFNNRLDSFLHYSVLEVNVRNNIFSSNVFNSEAAIKTSYASPISITANLFYLNTRQVAYLSNIRRMRVNRNSFLNQYNNTTEADILFGSTEPYNASNFDDNWWGTVEQTILNRKVRSYNFINITDFQKVLPQIYGLRSIVCNVEWSESVTNRKCYLPVKAVTNYDAAVEVCEKLGATLSSYSNIQSLLPSLTSTSRLWVSDSRCAVLRYSNSTPVTDCTQRASFICEQTPTPRCSSLCNEAHGVCHGTTCICKSGWKGENCLEYDCNTEGSHACEKCIAPNVCTCLRGWEGVGCTYSRCPQYSTCKTCTAQDGCGWCDEQQQCLPGTGNGTTNSIDAMCKDSWFFYNCITSEDSTACSANITKNACRQQSCNITLPTYKKKDCQICLDYEKCFKGRRGSCLTWNEETCPVGKTASDYGDTENRVSNIELRNGVIDLTNDDNATTILFACPYDDDSKQLIIFSDEKLRKLLKVNSTILSKQANGLMQRINSFFTIDNYTFAYTSLSSLENVIQYADINQEVQVISLEDELIKEHLPREEFLDRLREHETNRFEVHEMNSKVYKCVGQEYLRLDEKISQYSTFIVVENSEKYRSFKINDVLIANKSNGYLERVESIDRIKDNDGNQKTMIKTKLVQCNQTLVGIDEIEELVNRELSCTGGDQWPNLLVIDEQEDSVKIKIGSIVTGRESNSFAMKIVSIEIRGAFIYFECMPIIGIESSNDELILYSQQQKDPATKGSFEFPTFDLADLRHEFRNIPFAKIVIDARIKTKLTFYFDLKDKEDFPYVERIGAGFQMENTVLIDLTASIAGAMNFDIFSKDILKDKQIVRRVILLGPVPVPVGFYLSLNFKLQQVVTAIKELFFEAKYTQTYIYKKYSSFSVSTRSFGERVCDGVTSMPNSDPFSFNFDSQKPPDVFDTGKSSIGLKAIVTITPKLRAPDIGVSQATTSRASLPVWLQERKEKSIFDKIYVALQIKADIAAALAIELETCSSRCADPLNSLEFSVRGGLESINGSFGPKIGSYEGSFFSPSWGSVETFRRTRCIQSKISGGCCSCPNATAGIVDPYTRKCMCPCTCENSNTQSYIDPVTSKCQCELCPDKTPKKRKDNGALWCPCACSDRVIREQKADGACDCSCKCEDGSVDTLAADGSCPCVCCCQNCHVSRKRANGCYCPLDEAKCPNGEKGRWVDCELKCEDKNPCGNTPYCVSGRSGPKCERPDMTRQCSGCVPPRGYLRPSGGCSSECQCQCIGTVCWSGPCCDIMVPWGSGDVHFLAVNGKLYDFHGVGEFWYCRDIQKDYGIQIRTFIKRKYDYVSWIAGCAIKLKSHIFTVFVGNPPIMRLDGDIVQYNGSKQFLTLENNTVTISISGSLTIAIQVKDQSSISISGWNNFDLRSVVPSDNLNVEGLCGKSSYGTSANAFVGSDGTIYQNYWQFGKSWEIKRRTQSDYKWSWDESNFHPDDQMDDRFNETFLTILPYEMKLRRDNNETIIEDARKTCKKYGLVDELFDMCVLDVVVGGGPEFADNVEAYKINLCPTSCNQKGKCVGPNQCECFDGWTGIDCEISICKIDCGKNGKCVNAFCECDDGYDGSDCSMIAICDQGCTSIRHGFCRRNNECKCYDGFTGANCSQEATCLKVNNCSKQGLCVAQDMCRCDEFWSGVDCSQASCISLNNCSGNGDCVGFNKCQCNANWTGAYCHVASCAQLNHCSHSGTCSKPNVCECFDGFEGVDCSVRTECKVLDNCNSRGVCVMNATQCRCFTGYSGSKCEHTSCDVVNNCSNQGYCFEPNMCMCSEGYSGTQCVQTSCEQYDYCSFNGVCLQNQTCECYQGWYGDNCSLVDCLGVNNCSDSGVCVGPNECECYRGYDGASCEVEIGPNTYSPVFSRPLYITEIDEYFVANRTIAQVNASDLDKGRNGFVRYLIVADGEESTYFTIHETLGLITHVKPIGDLIVSALKLKIEAYDNGLPRKYGYTEVKVNINRVQTCNDIIDRTIGIIKLDKIRIGEIIVRLKPDGVTNRTVGYFLEEVQSQFLDIDVTSGEIRLATDIPNGLYSVNVFARQDVEEYTCELRHTFQIEVQLETESTTTSEVTSTSTVLTETRPESLTFDIATTNDETPFTSFITTSTEETKTTTQSIDTLSSTQTTQIDQPSSTKPSTGLPIGAIVGIVIASIVIVAALTGLIIVYRMKKIKHAAAKNETKRTDDDDDEEIETAF